MTTNVPHEYTWGYSCNISIMLLRCTRLIIHTTRTSHVAQTNSGNLLFHPIIVTLYGLVVIYCKCFPPIYDPQGECIVDPGSVCGFYIWRSDRKHDGQIAKQFVPGEQWASISNIYKGNMVNKNYKNIWGIFGKANKTGLHDLVGSGGGTPSNGDCKSAYWHLWDLITFAELYFSVIWVVKYRGSTQKYKYEWQRSSGWAIN